MSTAPEITMVAPLNWADILDICSRLHTTRTKPAGPWPDAAPREASRMIDAMVVGRPAQIVPTRMHEPGLYWRFMDVDLPEGLMRSPEDIELLHRYADIGEVYPA